MKAIPVEGLSATTSLEEASRRMVAVRTAELFAFLPTTLDEREHVALHEMRIAAKRLRYVLELVGFCLGEIGGEATNAARDLQSAIGEIHDSDVLLERLTARADRDDVGMLMLLERTREQRNARFASFTQLAAELDRSDLHRRLLDTAAAPSGPVPTDPLRTEGPHA